MQEIIPHGQDSHAKTLRDRTHQHSPQSKGNVILGQGYSTLAWIPEKHGSWALPLRHELITSFESPLTKAAFQLRTICRGIRVRPVSVWDSEYSNITFLKLTANIRADKLIRLRPNRCLWTAPPPYSGKGRPRVHGQKFKLSQLETYPPPDIELTLEDDQEGLVYLRRWFNLHFRNGKDYPLDLIAVQKINQQTQTLNPPMWLAWWGEEKMDTVELWRFYQRRFTIEHWNRFAKQRLHWTLPKLSSPRQCQRWSHLMPLMTWQLWLARNTVPDNPLPWQKRQLRSEMTPGRVAQGFASLLAMIGTPAKPPKLRGKSVGWKKGRKRNKKTKFPVVKKTYSPPKKKKKNNK